MYKTVLLAGCAIIASVFPALADDTSCSPKSSKTKDLVVAINCLQARLNKLETAEKTTVVHKNDLSELLRRNDPLLNDFVKKGDMSGYLKTGSVLKLGFDNARCLSVISGTGGQIGSPPFEVGRLTGLQECGGSPPMTIFPR